MDSSFITTLVFILAPIALYLIVAILLLRIAARMVTRIVLDELRKDRLRSARTERPESR